MRHTPYGYDIIGGKAVVNEEKAVVLRKICENYLSGMSFMSAAADAGLAMSHTGVKQLIQNKRLLGDSYYPAILSEETARQIEEERLRRAKALGRDQRHRNKTGEAKVHTGFSMPKVRKKYDDPVQQAEYTYSLIQSEVKGTWHLQGK